LIPALEVWDFPPMPFIFRIEFAVFSESILIAFLKMALIWDPESKSSFAGLKNLMIHTLPNYYLPTCPS